MSFSPEPPDERTDAVAEARKRAYEARRLRHAYDRAADAHERAGAITAHVAMAALDVTEVEVSSWALREGIVLGYVSVLGPGQPIPLQPLTRAADATVTALPRR